MKNKSLSLAVALGFGLMNGGVEDELLVGKEDYVENSDVISCNMDDVLIIEESDSVLIDEDNSTNDILGNGIKINDDQNPGGDNESIEEQREDS